MSATLNTKSLVFKIPPSPEALDAVLPDRRQTSGRLEQPIMLRRSGLASALSCSLRSIDNLQAKGMPCVFIGRSRRYILSEVIAWLKRKGGGS